MNDIKLNAGSNTLYLTPSNAQLIQIANENPDIYKDIKDSILKEMKSSAIKVTRNRLQSQANNLNDKLYSEVEKKVFNSGGWSPTISDSLRKKLSSEIEDQLQAAFTNELHAYMSSKEFQMTLKSKVREKMLNIALNQLDSQIQEEAKKLIA